MSGPHSHGAALLDVQQLLAPGARQLLKGPLWDEAGFASVLLLSPASCAGVLLHQVNPARAMQYFAEALPVI